MRRRHREPRPPADLRGPRPPLASPGPGLLSGACRRRVDTDVEDPRAAVAHRSSPRVSCRPGVTCFGTVVERGRITALRLTFSDSMSPGPRRVDQFLSVVSAGPDGTFGTPDDRVVYLRSASYRDEGDRRRAQAPVQPVSATALSTHGLRGGPHRPRGHPARGPGQQGRGDELRGNLGGKSTDPTSRPGPHSTNPLSEPPDLRRHPVSWPSRATYFFREGRISCGDAASNPGINFFGKSVDGF